MGERRGRTRSFDSDALAARTGRPLIGHEEPDEEPDDDPFADWGGESAQVPTGSQTHILPATSRTATVDDPLTTQLLAEVARRTSTIEIDPTTVEFARATREIDPELLAEVLDRDHQSAIKKR